MLHDLQKTKPVCRKLCSRNLKWHLLTAHWMISISSFCSCLLILNLKQLTPEAVGYCTTAGLGKFFLAPFCSAPVHLQNCLIFTVYTLSAYLTPSEFEESVADLGPKPTNKYLAPHTQLQDGVVVGIIAKSPTRTRTSPTSTGVICKTRE